MNLRTDRALVLRRHPYSESSLVVSALTREHGLVQFLARGAYRPRSRFYAVLDLFHELELEWKLPKSGELTSLRNGELIRRRRCITQSLARYRCAVSMLELSHLVSRAGHPERQLFDALSRGLDSLQGGCTDENLVRIEFELAFLRLHGLSPALDCCAACGAQAPPREDPPRVCFSAGAGGRLCSACGADTRAGGGRVGTLPLDVVEVAASLDRQQPIAASPDLLLRVRDFLERFLDFHLGTRPRSSREFLAAENRNAR
ncbi:MAG: DNA repair protein RecO (recombination protein O) [Candidatus Paceibacteria bacterium]